MSSTEAFMGSDAEKLPSLELREYFEGYVSMAESRDEEDVSEYVDFDKIKRIIKDLENDDRNSALEYIEGEIKRMEDMKGEWDAKGWGWEHEESPRYLEKLVRMKNHLTE